MKDFVSLKTVTANSENSTRLEILCDKPSENSLGIFETLEANIFPQIKERLEESVNSVVLKEELAFQKIDPNFEAFRYSDVPVVYNELYFPCDATRYAYLLTTVVGTVEKTWYQFDYDAHVGPFGSLVDEHGNSLSADVFKFTCFEQDIDSTVSPNAPIYLWPAEIYEVVPKALKSDSESKSVSIVFFVDWRYFLRDFAFENYLFTTNDASMAASIETTDGVFAVYKNVLNKALRPAGKNLVSTTGSPITNDWLVDVNPILHLRSLKGCCLPLAIDAALAYNGARLYGGRVVDKTFTLDVPIAVLSEGQEPTSGQVEYFRFRSGTSSTPTSTGHLVNAAKRLLATPSEARLSLYSRAGENASALVYGVTADASSKSKSNANAIKALKGLQGYCFHSVFSAYDFPCASDKIYVGLPRQESVSKWTYGSYRVAYRIDSFYEGWVLTAPNVLSSYNSVEDNNIDVGMYGNGANGGATAERTMSYGSGSGSSEYKIEEFDKIQPIGCGAILDDISGHLLVGQDATFSAENFMWCRAGVRSGSVVFADSYNGYVLAQAGTQNFCITNVPSNLEFEAGDTIQFARNPDDYTFQVLASHTSGGGEDPPEYTAGYYIHINNQNAILWKGFDVFTRGAGEEANVQNLNVSAIKPGAYTSTSVAVYGNGFFSTTIDWRGFKYYQYVSGQGETDVFAQKIQCDEGIQGSVVDGILHLSIKPEEETEPEYETDYPPEPDPDPEPEPDPDPEEYFDNPEPQSEKETQQQNHKGCFIWFDNYKGRGEH